MTTIRGRKWLGAVVLAVSCTWLLAACDDDGGGGGGTPANTNADGVTFATYVGASNAATAKMAMFPPRLVAPASGTEYRASQAGATCDVRFQWTAVPGAAYYLLQAGPDPSAQTLTAPEALSMRVAGTTYAHSFGPGDVRWEVQAVDAGGRGGPISECFNFSIGPIAIPTEP